MTTSQDQTKKILIEDEENVTKTSMCTWVVVRIAVPFWVLSVIRHLVCRGPKRGPKF